MEFENLFNLIQNYLSQKTLIKIIFSTPDKKTGSHSKVIISLKKLETNLSYQVEFYSANKVLHKNTEEDEYLFFIKKYLREYKNINFFTKESEFAVIKNKKNYHLKEKKIAQEIKIEEHNKKKNYILEDGKYVDFLFELGIMTSDGKVVKNFYNKFKQINKYLEFIRDVIDELQAKKELSKNIKIVDFGSGKSYLTFALYHYLKVCKNFDITVIGLDLKQDVIRDCSELAKKLNYSSLEFICEDIKNFTKLTNADIIISLHACDNATDFGITKGLELNAKAILAVPCCQHEFNTNFSKTSGEIKNGLKPVFFHGILQEKLSSIFTDAFRGNVLELCGYKTQIIEFIDMEHTPKNILIKAIRENKTTEYYKNKKEQCENFIKFMGFEPLLYKIAGKYFKI